MALASNAAPNRAGRERVARELREQGLKLREIAERMGCAIQTVDGYLNDPGGMRDAARKRSYAGTCVDCGAATSGSNGRGKAPERCVPCAARHNAPQTSARMRAQNAERRALIEAMWADGATQAEIAHAIGVNSFSAGARRVYGYDLPHRRTPEQRERIRAARWPGR